MTSAFLWLDAMLNVLIGTVLAGFPRNLIVLLGLPLVRHEFYARVLGAVLIGIGLALLVELWRPSAGLGLPGAIAINLCAAAMLVALLLLRSDVNRRGQTVLWGVVAILVCLSIAELALT